MGTGEKKGLAPRLVIIVLLLLAGFAAGWSAYRLLAPVQGEESARPPQTGEEAAVPEEAEARRAESGPEESPAAVPEETDPEETQIAPELPRDLPPLAAPRVSCQRGASNCIVLLWPDETDQQTARYVLMRRGLGGQAAGAPWTEVAEIPSDGVVSGEGYRYEDWLGSSAPQQYLYRIDAVPADPALYGVGAGAEIPGSNIAVCLDPGHYTGSSPLRGEELYGYEEGPFVLRVGLRLRDILRESYGIEVRMTREGDSITLYGYSNEVLDREHLSLRGSFAEGCDLFLSLHTNANLDQANGYPTCNQPMNIGKTLVFVNRIGAASDLTLAQANAIGGRLSALNFQLGIAPLERFQPGERNSLHSWSDAYNDALDTPGAVCLRLNDEGEDYYGVLRGASAAGVPGLIVEHCHHTQAAMRRLAAESDLDLLWAQADAAGIAEGYGFAALDSAGE